MSGEKIGSTTESISRLKDKLATAHRILYKLGLADYLGHVSARVVGTDIVLVKARGWVLGSLLETTPREIISVDLDGSPLEKKLLPPVETKMHTCIYRARGDVGSVVHTHQPITTAFGVAGRKIFPLHINAGGASAEVIAQGIPTFHRPDLINTNELGTAVAKVLGQHGACHLRGHGIVVVGRSVEEATLRAIEIEAQARLNWTAFQLGNPNPIPSESLSDFVAAYVRSDEEKWPPAYKGAWNYYAGLVGLEREARRKHR